MARSIDGVTIKAILEGILNATADGSVLVPSSSFGSTFTPSTKITSGTGAYMANRAWQSSGRVLAGSATEDIDLYDLGALDIGMGAGKDMLGQALALTDIVAMLITVDPLSVGSLLVGGKAAATAWNSFFHSAGTPDDSAGIGPIPPGGAIFLFAPTAPALAVADTSNHLLKMAATAAGQVIYSVALLGRG